MLYQHKVFPDNGKYRFCLNCFCNFQIDGIFEKHEKFHNDHDQINMLTPIYMGII